MAFNGIDTLVDSCDKVSVQYKDRVWEIDLNSLSTTMVARETSLLALQLQAALNLSRPPVGLSLRVAPGEEAVVCPLSVLIVCPSYISTIFPGISWTPLLEGGGPDDLPPPPTHTHRNSSVRPPAPVPGNLGVPRPGSTTVTKGATVPLLRPGSPLKVLVPDQDFSAWGTFGSTASPSEGWGRPLTAPPGNQTGGVSRPRPSRREGLGRPMSATPSDKSFGIRRMRPGKREGHGRPVSALPSDHSGSWSPACGLRESPSSFWCREEQQEVRDNNAWNRFGEEHSFDHRHRRPATAPHPMHATRHSSSSPAASRRGRRRSRHELSAAETRGRIFDELSAQREEREEGVGSSGCKSESRKNTGTTSGLRGEGDNAGGAVNWSSLIWSSPTQAWL